MWVYASWIRHALVEDSRAGLTKDDRVGLLISAAPELLANRPTMRPDIADDELPPQDAVTDRDVLLDRLCQFDFAYHSYASSNAALYQLTRVLAIRLGPQHITVNAIAPGVFPSEMMASTLDVIRDATTAAAPLRRLGRDDDMAAQELIQRLRRRFRRVGHRPAARRGRPRAPLPPPASQVLSEAKRQANTARFIYLNQDAAEHFFVDYDGSAVRAAKLRMEGGRNPHNEELTTLVGELSARSQLFR